MEPELSTAGEGRQQYHISLDERIRGMERNINVLQDLLDMIRGQDIADLNKEKLSSIADAPRPMPSLMQVLQDGSQTIHNSNMRIQEQIEELRELLF